MADFDHLLRLSSELRLDEAAPNQGKKKKGKGKEDTAAGYVALARWLPLLARRHTRVLTADRQKTRRTPPPAPSLTGQLLESSS